MAGDNLEIMTSTPKTPKLFKHVYTHGMCFPFITDSPTEALSWFGRGFHDSAQRETKELASRNFADYEALPAVFLFRHAAELYLKAIVWNGDELLSFLTKPVSGASGPEKANHALVFWLPYMKHITTQFGLTWNEEKFGPFSNLDSLLGELEKEDPGSFSFRYPMKKDGDASHDPKFGFNVVAFAREIDPVLEGLWDLCGDLEDLREHHMMAD